MFPLHLAMECEIKLQFFSKNTAEWPTYWIIPLVSQEDGTGLWSRFGTGLAPLTFKGNPLLPNWLLGRNGFHAQVRPFQWTHRNEGVFNTKTGDFGIPIFTPGGVPP